MKFGDEKIKGSTTNVDEDLRKIILALNESVTKLLLKQGEDYQLFALRALTSYAGEVFDRLISHQDFAIEYNAISARNLFECYLLIAYIISNPSRAKEFLSQKAYDELQISEGFLSIANTNTSEKAIKSIHDRMEFIEDLMKKNKLTPSKSWNVRDLAQKTNNETEYKAFFKLYSKYVHPSSWIVNSYKIDYANPVFKNIFILQGQHYASCITKLVYKYLNSKNID